jgi:microcompartment protein CcmK/EutM
MVIGEVIGSVVATRKTANMDGLPLRIVRVLKTDNTPTATYVVAVDLLNAAVGERVLLASGSPARQTKQTDARPVDAIIMAVVDTWQIHNHTPFDRNVEIP